MGQLGHYPPVRETMNLSPNFSYDRTHFHKKNGILPSSLPVILMRVTSYTEDGEVIAVEEVPYYNNAKSLSNFRSHIMAAMDVGLDIAIVTTCEIGKIVRILDLANH